MLVRATFAAVLGLGIGLPSRAQTSSPDSRTLDSILSEIRGIHDDIRVTETSQILLTELGMQQSLVIRAIQRVDDARTKLTQVQAGQRHMTGDLERLENQMIETSDSAERRRISGEIERMKNGLVALKLEEQQDATSLQEAQEKMKSAQDALDSTQSELNDIVKRLRPGQ